MSHGIYHPKMTIYHQKGSFIVGCGCLVVIVGLVVFAVFL